MDSTVEVYCLTSAAIYMYTICAVFTSTLLAFIIYFLLAAIFCSRSTFSARAARLGCHWYANNAKIEWLFIKPP
jgi:hypothetical protein